MVPRGLSNPPVKVSLLTEPEEGLLLLLFTFFPCVISFSRSVALA